MSSSSEKACSLHRKACAVRNEKGAQFERNLQELATTISSIDIWKLNGENFEIVTKMRELKDSIEEIKAQCK